MKILKKIVVINRKFFLVGVLAVATAVLILILRFHPYPHRFFETVDYGLCSERLTRSDLDNSLMIGTQFMLNNQKNAGNFNYEYDWIKKIFTPGDSQVRQAGAMWGLSLIYQDNPTSEIAAALEKNMFFFKNIPRLIIVVAGILSILEPDTVRPEPWPFPL